MPLIILDASCEKNHADILPLASCLLSPSVLFVANGRVSLFVMWDIPFSFPSGLLHYGDVKVKSCFGQQELL